VTRRLRLAWHRWARCGPDQEPANPDDEWVCPACGGEFYVLPVGLFTPGWRWHLRERTP
jgi:hypothetical protein